MKEYRVMCSDRGAEFMLFGPTSEGMARAVLKQHLSRKDKSREYWLESHEVTPWKREEG